MRKYYLLNLSLFVFLGFLFLLTRIQNLTSLPVFGDEAIYIRWSQIIKNVETLRFIPLTDGKQPFFMWLTVPFLKVFSDPLFAGRITSVFAGFMTLTGLIAVLHLVFSLPLTRSILFSSVYIFLPYAFFFDRLASADSLLSAFSLWTFLFTYLLARKPSLDKSMILGLILGLAWITKSPAIYYIVLSVIGFAILSTTKTRKHIYFAFLSAFISFVIYNLLRLGPQFHQIALRNMDYVWPLGEIIKHPFDPLKSHLFASLKFLSFYISLPLLLVTLSFKSIKSKQLLLVTVLWLALPWLATISVARVITSRYLLFNVPYITLLIALGLNYLFDKSKNYFYLSLLLFIPNILLITRMSLSPFTLTLPTEDSGYISGWTSGWGIRESSDLLIDRSRQANVIVGSEGYFGTLPDGLQIYTDGTPQLTVVPIGIGITSIPQNLLVAKESGDSVFLLFNLSRLNLSTQDFSKLKLVSSYPKPDADKLVLLEL